MFSDAQSESLWRGIHSSEETGSERFIPLGQTPTGATTFDPMEHARASASLLDPASYTDVLKTAAH